MDSANTCFTTLDQGLVAGGMDSATGVASFLGLPYADVPDGGLRFERPGPPRPWKGVRGAHAFGARSLQRRPFSDMVFRSTSMSEDCLTLNIWTPRPTDTTAMLPILLYIHGGAFLVGDGSEPRHDGTALAAQGIVFTSVNYRLGLFGFFAHPELRGANAGLFDLVASLDWLRANARAFGGDPDKITIAGSSSGAFAVCALLASPMAKDKVAGAVVQSGALLSSRLTGLCTRLPMLADWQRKGSSFAMSVGATTAQAMKSMPAFELLGQSHAGGWNSPVIDGELLPDNLLGLFKGGHAARVPLIAGIASAERSFDMPQAIKRMSAQAFREQLMHRYGNDGHALFAAYGAPQSGREADIAARDLAADQWIGADTFHLCTAMSSWGSPVFSYVFDHARPAPAPGTGGWTAAGGAGHSTDIEYFLGTQALTEVYGWTSEDRALSARMSAYLVNFVKTGNPNAGGLPAWPDFATRQRIVLAPQGGVQGLAPTACLAGLQPQPAAADIAPPA